MSPRPTRLTTATISSAFNRIRVRLSELERKHDELVTFVLSMMEADFVTAATLTPGGSSSGAAPKRVNPSGGQEDQTDLDDKLRAVAQFKRLLRQLETE